MELIVGLCLFTLPFLIIASIFYIYHFYHHQKENKEYNKAIEKIRSVNIYHEEMNRNNKDKASLPAICDV